MRSILPLVDEWVINVGIGDDDTLARIKTFAQEEGAGKVKWFESDWKLDDPEKKKGGMILSEQTNLALERCQNEWCMYLQGDEVFHEEDIPRIRQALTLSEKRPEVEGLLFNYIHFYGSFDVIQHSRSVYRHEVRVVRKSSGAQSVGDAQSFRKKDGSKLQVVSSGARIFHYGWVRTPEAMKEKTFFMDQLYHGEPDPKDAANGTPHTGDNYRYKRIWGLKPYLGSHPKVMKERIKNKGWHWDLKNSPMTYTWRDSKKVVLDSIEQVTGCRLFEYRSYKKIRD